MWRQGFFAVKHKGFITGAGIGLITAVAVGVAVVTTPSPPAPLHIGATGQPGWDCTYTDPEYMIHAGNGQLTTYPGTAKFDVNSLTTYTTTWSDPYLTAGYNSGISSQLCNTRKLPAGGTGRSYAVPVQVGKQGNPVASIHTVTSDNFYGDSGYDIWFTGSPSVSSYRQMTNGGAATTELMIWTSHPGLLSQNLSPDRYPVSIDGHRWWVDVGLAADGHGKSLTNPNGWNVVNFIAPNTHIGNVVLKNLRLDPFGSYAISHGWLKPGDYWEGINAGFEMTEGKASLQGFTLTGLPH
jgi:hypothetical protein